MTDRDPPHFHRRTPLALELPHPPSRYCLNHPVPVPSRCLQLEGLRSRKRKEHSFIGRSRQILISTATIHDALTTSPTGLHFRPKFLSPISTTSSIPHSLLYTPNALSVQGSCALPTSTRCAESKISPAFLPRFPELPALLNPSPPGALDGIASCC